jgi:asparagine synthase (glutamine-hydrolysing)
VCGIGGLILMPPGPVKPEWLRAFMDALEHRGPDDAGWLSLLRGKLRQGRDIEHDLATEALLIHRRLSILDLSEAGHQPMSTPEGRYWITFNGEIYNYVELREQLRQLGHTFRSQSDTEVLLAAFQQWGTESLTRLVGMFAFAILDVQTRRLLLARDFFGIKPLYYVFWQEGLAFASEIKPLLGLPGVTRDANPHRVHDYLYSGITDYGTETMFAQVHQVPAAHYLELSLDKPRSLHAVRYWNIDMTQRADLSFEDAARQLRDLFIDSVRMHLRSDVPIGGALSGGIDSSSIVSVMRLLEPNLEFHTFSYLADDPRISEERWADIVGKEKQVVIHKVRLCPDDFPNDLDDLIETQGEPFMSTSMYAQWRVFQAARKAGVKVMLDGQGADELLGGYPTHRFAMLRGLVRRGRMRDAWLLARSASGPAESWRLMARAIGRSAPVFLQTLVRRAMRGESNPTWLNTAWFKANGIEQGRAFPQNGKKSLSQELYRTLTESSLPMLLHYEDRNSMAFSIESRVPFLTPSLATFLLSLPDHYLVGVDGTSKSVFRRAMRGIVPDQILDRRDKVGFFTPERDWLMAERSFVQQVLNGATARRIAALNVNELLREWTETVQGCRQPDSSTWRCLNLILWAQKFSATAA